MTAKEHTNLLSIFGWVYAGIQALFVCLYIILVLMYGGMGAVMAFSARQTDVAGMVMMFIMVVLFSLIAIVGLVCVIANIWMGKRLRGDALPTQRSMIVIGILNCISWICGGMCLMPFGIALGAYGIWFGVSETGRAFLEGRALTSPPSPAYYHGQGNADIWRQ